MRFLLIDRKSHRMASALIACEYIEEVKHQLQNPYELGRPLTDFIIVIEQDNGMAEVFHNTKTGLGDYLRELDQTANLHGVCGNALVKSHIVSLRKIVEDQKKWIDDHGGNLAGYIARYGIKGTIHCFGDGGEAIYKADSEALRKYEDQLKKLEAKE